jgi:hypothetical protein
VSDIEEVDITHLTFDGDRNLRASGLEGKQSRWLSRAGSSADVHRQAMLTSYWYQLQEQITTPRRLLRAGYSWHDIVQKQSYYARPEIAANI